jgi:hypothetical protein
MEKDIRHVSSDIGGFSLPEWLFEGTRQSRAARMY